jgi:hypothetical protein
MGNRIPLLRIGLCSLVGALGCAPEEETFEFGRADMEAFVYGAYAGTYIPPEEVAIALVLQVRPRDEATRHLACASREFSDSEQPGTPGLEVMCDSTTSLDISGTLHVNDGTTPVELDGWFTVFGTSFGDANVWLNYRNLPTTRLNISYQADRWQFCDIRNGDAYVGSCTIDSRLQ